MSEEFKFSDWVTCEYETVDPEYSGDEPHPWRMTCVNPKMAARPTAPSTEE